LHDSNAMDKTLSGDAYPISPIVPCLAMTKTTSMCLLKARPTLRDRFAC
ncbi:hypothetical protein LCGC14_2311050, partial [marine sediment metagenome]